MNKRVWNTEQKLSILREAEAIFKQRNATMRQAQIRYPKRWGSRSVKLWDVLKKVVLNPDKKNDFFK